MRADRYLTALIARSAVVVALVAAALLTAVDALDPTARGQTAGECLPRALWLSAAAVVIALALAPAAVCSVLARGGASTALRAAGRPVSRLLVVPVLVAGLAGAPCAGALAAAATRAAVLHPGHRPQPLDVVPWGAPRAGCWYETPAGPVFTPSVQRTGCLPPGREALPWLLAVAALVAGPCALAAGTGGRRGAVRGAWAGAAVALLVLVAGVVAAAHAATVGGARAGEAALVVLIAAVTGAATGAATARTVGA